MTPEHSTDDDQAFKLPVKRVKGETVEERLTENAYERILPARYLLKDDDGNVTETPEELFERVAKNVAQPDKEYDDHDYEESWKTFFDLMTNLEFMPNSPTLMNAGAELQQLSACFVVHPEDDMDSIFGAVHDAAKIFQTGGGVGYPFHLIRPKGDRVNSTGGIASGSLSFQKVFDTMCGTIKQGGKRRGAQMGIMRVDHPDVLRFVVSKRKEGELSNFNISVGLTEEFMEAVKNDEEYTMINPQDGEPHTVNDYNCQFYNSDEEWYPEAAGSDQGKDDNFWRDFADTFSDEIQEYDIDLEPGNTMTLPARFIWDALIDGAWRNGEPGLFMYDEGNKQHSFDVEKHPEHKMEATNPCAEQILENYEPCNLGHINLSLLVESQGANSGMDFHWWVENHEVEYDSQEELNEVMQDFMDDALRNDKFEEIARHGTRFLDNVVTMSDFPLEEITQKAEEQRKVGLGLMGFAQMLVQLGIEYGSEESVAAAKEIQRRITQWSVLESQKLAEERGRFTEWENSKWANPTEYEDWFRRYTGGLDPEEYEDGFVLRNHNTVTIAPTGTTSMIGNTSGGCEPIYQVAYYKNVAKDIQGEDMLVEFDDYFLKVLEANDVDVEEVKAEVENLMENSEWEGVQSLDDEVLPQRVKKLFKTSGTVKPKEHIDIQGAFQIHNHSGISKTCNFPHSASREDVAEAYMRAYDKGIKGLTVYRDGTRDVQVMQQNKENTITDMDTVDAIAEIASKFDSAMEFLQSEEMREALDDADEVKVVTQEAPLEDSERLEELEENMEQRMERLDSEREPETRDRPKVIQGTTQEITTAYGDLFVTVNEDEDGIFEVFCQVGKSGGYTQSFTEALGRVISLAMRNGVPAEEVVKQLKDIRSPQVSWDNGEQIHSPADGVAKAIHRHMNGFDEGQQTLDEAEAVKQTSTNEGGDLKDVVKSGSSPTCPECGAMKQLKEGCESCPSCGWSKC